jgi:peptidoglycan hydrolase CwlO-like protein
MQHIRINKATYKILLCFIIILLLPTHAAGEVVPITELQDKLDNISEEEKTVLTELFSLEQDMAALEADELKITDEIAHLQKSIKQLENSIEEKQSDYDRQCEILKKVLVNYQRRGPASYLEILLQAEDLSSFIKSLNIIKDISHNTSELLEALKKGQKELKDKKYGLEKDYALLEQKQTILAQDLHKKQLLQQQKKEYLASLKQDSEHYQEKLEMVSSMWEDCTKLFPDISKEITDIIGAGNFTLEDLHIKYGFLNIAGYIEEETFNSILTDNTKLPKTIFRFEEGKVVIEVPEERLLLKGNFHITGDSAVSFEAEEGYFYDLPLEKASIDEIFKNGPLIINFELIADNVIAIDFKITDVECQDGTLNFIIIPQL